MCIAVCACAYARFERLLVPLLVGRSRVMSHVMSCHVMCGNQEIRLRWAIGPIGVKSV